MQLYLGLLQLDFATSPMNFSIFERYIDGVVRFPSGVEIIFSFVAATKTATAEFVVLSQYQ